MGIASPTLTLLYLVVIHCNMDDVPIGLYATRGDADQRMKAVLYPVARWSILCSANDRYWPSVDTQPLYVAIYSIVPGTSDFKQVVKKDIPAD